MRAGSVRLVLPATMLGAGTLLAYLLWIRPWQLRWGATDEEVESSMPGDEIVRDPTFDATRAVTVEVGPEEIWPWILQIGYGRAGWYSYDWVDNLGRPSADQIFPELQNLDIGDLVPMGPGENLGLWVNDFDPDRWMLWWDKKGRVTWLWLLQPVGEGRRASSPASTCATSGRSRRSSSSCYWTWATS